MNKKQLIVAWNMSFIILLCLSAPAYSLETEYEPARYMDMDGDLADEIIVEARQGAGSNHYVEDMRIFKDESHELKLIFSIKTLDSSYGFEPSSPYNCNEVSEVEFTEQNLKNGTRDIIVKTKKIYFKDGENKVVDKEEDLGIKVFKWDGKSYVENKGN